MITDNNTFIDCLDTVLVISKPAREDSGEDSFYCAVNDNSAIVSVCDGCGGLGARRYESFKNHTGAYIASRIVSASIHDWNRDNCRQEWSSAKLVASSIEDYILDAYDLCKPYDVAGMQIKGSMVRKFPTTLALAYAQKDKKGMLIHILWAGDSRVYLLDKNGLAQLTKDDTEVEDAFDNLVSDGAMNNVLSADGDFKINHRTIRLSDPALIFAATDGCFGYVSSPMEFEYILLDSLVNKPTPVDFKRSLNTILSSYAGDDLAMGMMSFFYGSYQNSREQLTVRMDELRKRYIDPLEVDSSEKHLRDLWSDYKPVYERFLKKDYDHE